MDAVTTEEFVLGQAYLVAVLSLLVWIVLRSRRLVSVNLWCLAGGFGFCFQVLLFHLDAGHSIPRPLEFLLLSTAGIGGMLLKAFSLHWLEDPPHRFKPRTLVFIVILNALIALALSVSPVSRAHFSIYVFIGIQMSALGVIFFAWRLARWYRLLNASLLVGTFAVVAVPACLILALDIAAGKDLLAIEPGIMSQSAMAVAIFLIVFNNGLFVGVVTDLAARRDKASAREIQRLKEQQLRLEERARLMANLHDGLGSQLASARLGLEHVTLDTERIRMLLDECLSDLHLVVDTMNNNDGSLADALRFLRHRVSARLSSMQPQIHWELDVDSVQGLDGELLLQLLRIVQEALTNALKHASARHIRIGASEDAGYLHLSVRDDGQGFSPEATKGQGLRNMHQRARRIGATLRVTGTPAGTRVELTLPLHGGGSDQEDSVAS